MISFRRIDVDDMPWEKLNDFTGANIFHTRTWINFLADFLGAEPVVAAVQSDGKVRGYFTGLITRKFGLKILGSPFRGWNTYFMGFNLMPGISYHDVLKAFPRFAFDELNCHFLMIIDANLRGDECESFSYHVRKISNFVIDLTKSEEQLFADMKGNSGRTSIRKTIKRGVVIEETTDPGFADEFYIQYQDVNSRKSLLPYFGLDFVRQMITHLTSTGNLLLLRAKNKDGVCIATHISLVFNKVAIVWGSASLQQYLSLRPNELIYWYAMKRLKGLGVEVLQLADGVKQFKEKLGAYETPALRLMQARSQFLFLPFFVVISINERVRLLKLKVLGK